jgi:hypothetical protein
MPLAMGVTPFADLNVKDFGAVGNGVTDDTHAINAALAASHAQKKNLYFPPGTYLCNTITDQYGTILAYDAGNSTGILIYGTSATITTTLNRATTLLYIFAYSRCSDLTINQIAFNNTHMVFDSVTSGIFFAGTNGQNLDSTNLINCRFQGFARAVGGQGMDDPLFRYDTFLAPRGHDDATTDTKPAVFLSLYDNTSGICNRVRVLDCEANGYTGPFPLNCKRPMDGFLFGQAYGITVMRNHTQNLCEEHYFLFPQNGPSTAPIIISANNLDCSLPRGCLDDNNKPHKINYGIRCDESHADINTNILQNYTYGIMVRGIDWPNNTLSDILITHNYLTQATDTNTYSPQAAVFVQGNNTGISAFHLTYNQANLTTVTPFTFLATTGIVTSNFSFPTMSKPIF